MPKTLKQLKPAAQQNTRPDESNHKSRNWICTLNNWTEVEYAKLLAYGSEKAQYCVIGKEVGKTGVPHLQAFFQMKTPYSGQTIKNSTSKRMWMGTAPGPEKARKYCMKDGDFIEVGEFKDSQKNQSSGGKQTGKANKEFWEALNKDINDGYSEKEIKDKYSSVYFKHHSGISRGITVANAIPRRKEKTCVHVYVGPPGCGKTTKATELGGEDAFFYNSPNKIWWSGYDGKEAVVMDDFHGNYPFEDLKKLLDKYPHQVPVHGAMITFNPKMIVMTSNEMPGTWYREEVFKTHGYSALLRRINVLQIWDAGKKQFIDSELTERLWNDGCVCDPKFPEPQTPPIIQKVVPEKLTLEKMKRSAAVLDLSNSSFLDEPVHQTSTSLPPPKKRKVQSSPPSKQVGALTKQLDDLYGPSDPIPEDPFEVVTISDSDDEDSNSDPVDSFDSEDPNNMDDDEEISESLE